MTGRGCTLLTGATGLLGRYLLCDLLESQTSLAVLARAVPGKSAEERIKGLHEFWEESLQTRLPRPIVLAGDLCESDLGLQAADRAWLSRHCRSIIHAAANLSFRSCSDGEPERTNTAGTRRLLQLARELGITDFHHVSTSFVCGERAGTIREDELDRGQSFHNVYESSKFEAERELHASKSIRITIYRPSVIVGDSRTGYTSTYHGFYHFLGAADRLARPLPGARNESHRHLRLRLPLTGREPRNLVPVDWVSRAIVRIHCNPALHGRTYHLVARHPTTVADIKAVAEELLRLQGIELVGTDELDNPTPIEDAFLASVRDYWPYRGGDPVFNDANTQIALPDLPPPRVDRVMLARLVRFAVSDRWGRRRGSERKKHSIDCSDYIESYFPAAAGSSFLAQLPINATLGFQVRGPGGGDWLCRVKDGRVIEVIRDTTEPSDVVYRTDVETFAALVQAKETAQSAFFARRIEIAGSVEKGLKLAALFTKFVREHPYLPTMEGRRELASPR